VDAYSDIMRAYFLGHLDLANIERFGGLQDQSLHAS
jgi:hypothetical protein